MLSIEAIQLLIAITLIMLSLFSPFIPEAMINGNVVSFNRIYVTF